MSGFDRLGLSDAVRERVAALGFTEPTPIQQEAIPLVAAGRDVVGQAQTGSGKTAAFGLPAIDHVDPASPDIQVLVLVPTRELAIQVAQAMRTFADEGTNVIAVFGGQPIREQTEQLRRGPQIAVGTPGRVMDLIRRGWLQLHSARYVVLDEADEMLSLGFLEDVEWILKRTPAGRQTMLFSATMPPPIRRLAERYLIEPTTVRVASPTLTVESVSQVVVEVEPREKLDTLIALLKAEQPTAAIVFRRRKIGVDELARALRDRGVEVSALHGGMTQGQRDSVMLRFRAGRARTLIATNVAARGLDISHVSHVISYDIPDDPEEYTHRIGRTARVGRSGLAFTFAGRRDTAAVAEIERVTGAAIERIPASEVARGGFDRRPVAAPKPNAEEAVSARSVARPAPSGDTVRLFVGAGRRHGLKRDALVELFRDRTGVEPARTRVHHAFSFVDVPTAQAARAVERMAGTDHDGRDLRVTVAERQPEPGPADEREQAPAAA
jgi:ATP-dependent RNA helicase DeaD